MGLIDAEAVYKDMKNKLVLKPEEFATRVHYIQSAALNCVAGASTIEAKPVIHAHWEKVREGRHICSNCKVKASLTSDEYDYMEDLSDYCHTCGAQMDEVIE